MCLAERVTTKTFNLPPHFGSKRVFVSLFLTIRKKIIPDLLKFFMSSVFATHCTAQHICFSHVEARKMMRHLYYIFLVNHHAICFFQQLFHLWMQVSKIIRMMIAINVLFHHTTLRHSWPDNGTRSNQRQVIIALKFLQQLAHGRTFNIKATDGICIPDTGCYLFIFFELFNLCNIYLDMLVFFNYVYCFADMTKSALA